MTKIKDLEDAGSKFASEVSGTHPPTSTLRPHTTVPSVPHDSDSAMKVSSPQHTHTHQRRHHSDPDQGA